MRKLLIATRNKGKFSEIVSKLNGLPFDFLNLNDAPSLPPGYDVEEPAATFEGNAIIKAMTLGRKPGFSRLPMIRGLKWTR